MGSFEEFHSLKSPLARYALALALFFFALLLRFIVAPEKGGLAFVTFYPAILIAFYICGLGPGIMTAVLSGLAGSYFFLPPYYSFPPDVHGQVNLLFFSITSFLIGILITRLYRYNDIHKHLASELESNSRHNALVLHTMPVAVYETDHEGSESPLMH